MDIVLRETGEGIMVCTKVVAGGACRGVEHAQIAIDLRYW